MKHSLHRPAMLPSTVAFAELLRPLKGRTVCEGRDMSSVAENADNRARKPVVKRAGLVIASGLLASGVAGAAYAGQIKTV